jgi:hypothetical protein
MSHVCLGCAKGKFHAVRSTRVDGEETVFDKRFGFMLEYGIVNKELYNYTKNGCVKNNILID